MTSIVRARGHGTRDSGADFERRNSRQLTVFRKAGLP